MTFKALGQTAEGKERAPVRFSWKFDDHEQPRYWMIFTGQPDFIPKYQYQVRVIVKGSIFTSGMEWVGPWVDAQRERPADGVGPDTGRRRRDALAVAARNLDRAPRRPDGAPPVNIPAYPPAPPRPRPRTAPPHVISRELVAGQRCGHPRVDQYVGFGHGYRLRSQRPTEGTTGGNRRV